MKLDIGCGGRKRSTQHVGIDVCAIPGVVDHVVNFENDRLPIADRSVDELFSSHCFEHIAEPGNILNEIGRVMKPGGKVIIYTPYPHTDDQWLNGHVSGWSWSRWDHIASMCRQDYSRAHFQGAFLRWDEATYAVHGHFKAQLEALKIPLRFGVKHMINGVHEWGCEFTSFLKTLGCTPLVRLSTMGGTHSVTTSIHTRRSM